MKLTIETNRRAVSAAGTPERIIEQAHSVPAMVISIRANTDNAGNIYIGNNSVNALDATGVSGILSPGETLYLDVSHFADAHIDLNEIWIDADNNGEGISYVAFLAV